MYLVVFVVITLLCHQNAYGQRVLDNGCFIPQGQTTRGYACEGQNIIIICDNSVPSATKIDCTTAQSQQYGGSTTNRFCYPNDNEGPKCGPAPGTCTSVGTFSATATGVDGCKNYFVCLPIPGIANSFTQILFGCPPGENFSAVEGKCIVGTCIRTTTPAPTTTTTTATTTTTTTLAPGQTTTTTLAPGQTTTTVATTTQRCKYLEMKEDPTSCRRYIICDLRGRLITKTCPWFHRFDTPISLCRRTSLVNCGSRPNN